MNKRRLLAAAEFLRNLKLPNDAEFDMGTWGRHPDDHKPKLNDCGTVACAWGWIAQSPAAQRAGVKVRWAKLPRSDEYEIVRITFGRKTDPLESAMKYFGIDGEQASDLFLSWRYPLSLRTQPGGIRPEDVAARMVKLVQEPQLRRAK